MNCHMVYTNVSGPIIIPGCWPVIHTNDKTKCICIRNGDQSVEARILKLESKVRKLEKQLAQ